MINVLIFYKYIEIKNPEEMRIWQRNLCQSLDLKGRILLGTEGINGTLAGSEENTAKYIEAMNDHPLFSGIDFKTSFSDNQCFPKLKVKVRQEIVRLGIDPHVLTPDDGGKHLSPEETHQLLASSPEDLVVFDARNAYEAKIGKFTGAITPDIENFRDLPKFIDENSELFKDKQVLMYCTGGIRCERATAYLKQKNIAKDVYQIKGGIHRYIEQFPDGFFRGKNYVFDGRIAVRVNKDILSTCELCNISCDDYTNCINAVCNKHYIACQPCIKQLNNTCSTECMNKVANHDVVIRKEPAKTAHAVTADLEGNR